MITWGLLWIVSVGVAFRWGMMSRKSYDKGYQDGWRKRERYGAGGSRS
jgi:hypothetical protein